MFTRGDIFRYVFLPQIAPRLHGLLGSGFGHLAYFIAQIYRAARLIPAGHPCLQARSIGDYHLRDVMGIAASNLKFTKGNIDQIIVFFAIIAGIVMLCAQFFILLLSFLVNPAFAQDMPDSYGDYFVLNANPAETDIAFRLLRQVFGVPDIFGSAAGENIPTTFHHALHGLFQIYSTALLVIAVLIALYFIIAVLAETAQTGTPFGKRFNHVWAPIRLVIGIGALIPLGYGLNSAQWVTLYAAKFGSSFASNGWAIYHETLKQEYLGNPESLVGTPQIPEFQHLPAFMMLVKTCKIAEEERRGVGRTIDQGNGGIDAYLVKNTAEGGANIKISDKSTWKDAVEFFNYGDIRIRFGSYNNETYKDYRGHVFPYCGDLVLQTTSHPEGEPGSVSMHEFYYQLIKDLWTGDHFGDYPRQFAEYYAPKKDRATGANPPSIDDSFKEQIYTSLQTEFENAINEAVEAQTGSENWKNNIVRLGGDEINIAEYGWGGGGVWYNKVAQINGDLMTSVLNVPRPKEYPFTLSVILVEKMKEDQNLTEEDKFKPYHSDGRPVNFPYLGDERIADALNHVYLYWHETGYRSDSLAAHTNLTGNAFIDAINAILGTQGLFDICKNTLIHPLAQLSMVGKGIMEAAIRNLASSVTGGILASAAIFQEYQAIPGLLKAASSFYSAVAGVGIIIGFVMFYIVPFMPFLYFFFAVGGWVKGLFEAMVGVPLWALAHLRIDGEGLPGDAAAAGYFLVFEVFVRPILIIFGLLASIAIFSAMTKVLNEIFYLVVSNMSGFDVAQTTCGPDGQNSNASSPEAGSAEFFRGPIDEFFFTIIYTIIIYMMGMSSFKLIDLIPNNILRWMGRGEASFGDQAGEPAEGLMQRMSTGGYAISNSLQEAGRGLSGAADAAAQGVKAGSQQQS